MGRESEEGTGRDGSRNAYVALTLSVLYFFLLVLIKIDYHLFGLLDHV